MLWPRRYSVCQVSIFNSQMGPFIKYSFSLVVQERQAMGVWSFLSHGGTFFSPLYLLAATINIYPFQSTENSPIFHFSMLRLLTIDAYPQLITHCLQRSRSEAWSGIYVNLLAFPSLLLELLEWAAISASLHTLNIFSFFSFYYCHSPQWPNHIKTTLWK